MIHDAMKKQLSQCFTVKLWVCWLAVLLTGPGMWRAAAQTQEMQFPASANNLWPTVLANGNFVVASSGYDENGVDNIGAVFLFDGQTKQLISTLKGSKSGDGVGGSVIPLPNGNFVVVSYYWDNGALYDVGAVTYVNGVTGLNGVVSPTNSLIGASNSDMIGINGVTVLPNGHYLVKSYSWRNAGKNSLGAVTWCDGNTGSVGTVSAANSLVGASDGDYVGMSDIIVLTNGNYVVASPSWDNGALKNVGAVTWCNGATGRSGVVGTANSLVGSTAGERAGGGVSDDGAQRVTALSNGNYVIASPAWKNGALDSAGAVTWCDGGVGRVGVESAAVSLVGGNAKDKVGLQKAVALTNGNYVVSSPFWKNGAAENAGAVTWCSGSTGATGLVSVSNSLVGTDGTDFVGGSEPVTWQVFSLESMGPPATVVPLTNGNYVVISFNWNRSGLKWAGAVTWGNGTTGTVGAVSPANSLVGTVSMDRIGQLGVTALANGHYVVSSPLWSNGAKLRVGAVTWCDGVTGRVGDVTAANSFIGSNQDDHIAGNGTTALTNGNYVIKSHVTSVNGMAEAGMATWANGSGVLTGSPDATNSIYGSKPSDLVGWYVIPFPNGSYLVNSNAWNGAAGYEGALTYGNGTVPISGPVSSANSLVGTYQSDRMGLEGVNVLPDGNFFVVNRHWNNGVGAVTWVNSATTGTSGEVNDCNSALGNPVGPLGATLGVYNPTYNYIISGKIGRTVLVFYYPAGAPFLSKSGDTGSASLSPSQTASLMGGTGCRIVATVESWGYYAFTGKVTAKVWVEPSVPTFGSDPFVARHYEINPEQNASNATGRVVLYFSQGDFDAFNAAPGSTNKLPTNPDDAAGKANLRVGKYVGTSSDGTGLPGSYPAYTAQILDPTDEFVVWNDIYKRWEVTLFFQGFGSFFVQTISTPLPVQLVSFNARAEEKNVRLDWEIADAINVSHFEIERSTDGKKFEFVGRKDFDAAEKHYIFKDNNPRTDASGQAFYRLKMQDLDETYAYSKIVAVRLYEGNAAYVYPNPVADHFKISLPGYDGITGTLRLVNTLGKVMLNKEFTVKKGEIGVNLKQARLEDGIYTIQLDLGGERRQFKIVHTH